MRRENIGFPISQKQQLKQTTYTMTELDLFKWIKDWEPEHRWDLNGETGREDVIIWVSVHALESFLKLTPYSLFDEGGIECRLQHNHIAIWASDVCDSFDIKIENIFKKEKQ